MKFFCCHKLNTHFFMPYILKHFILFIIIVNMIVFFSYWQDLEKLLLYILYFNPPLLLNSLIGSVIKILVFPSHIY